MKFLLYFTVIVAVKSMIVDLNRFKIKPMSLQSVPKLETIEAQSVYETKYEHELFLPDSAPRILSAAQVINLDSSRASLVFKTPDTTLYVDEGCISHLYRAVLSKPSFLV